MGHDQGDPAMRMRSARRVQIVGGSGAGKSQLAQRLGKILNLPVHHLDEIAIDQASRRHRTSADCRTAAREIAAGASWIAEGIYVDWAGDLFRTADVIVWLDNVSARQATARIVRRFAKSALSTARAERGVRRFTRFRDYARELRGLAQAMRETYSYHRRSRSPRKDAEARSRRGTAATLGHYSAKTIRLRGQRDVDALIRSVS